MKTFRTRIIEADDTFFDGELESLTVPTIDGEYGVLAQHQNLVVAIIPGTVRYKPVGEEEKLAAVSDGMMRVEDNDVLLLVDSAERPEEIDLAEVKAKEIAMREAMLQKKNVREYALAEASLKRAIARQRIKGEGLN